MNIGPCNILKYSHFYYQLLFWHRQKYLEYSTHKKMQNKQTYSVVVTPGLCKATSVLYTEWLHSKLRDDPCMSDTIRWGVVLSYTVHEHSEHSHMVNGKYPCSPWNSPPWCTVSVFFENIINWNPHIDTVHEYLGHVTGEEIVDASFQECRAMCHTARATVRKMSVCFRDVIISKGLWII
jgi:hypothetical protein